MSSENPQRKLAALEAEVRSLRQALGQSAPPPVLSKREALLVEAERVAHMGSWAWNLRTNEISWSDEFYRILGLSPARVEPSAAGFFGAIHPDDRSRVEAVTSSSLEAGAPAPVEFRIVRPSGDVRDVRMEAALVDDEEGARAYVVGTVLDVTEERRTAALLARTVEELTEAERLARLGSWRWDLVRERVEFSSGMRHVLGMSATEQPTLELFMRHVHPLDRERVVAETARARAAGIEVPMEYRIVRDDGSVRDVAVNPRVMRDPNGTVTGFFGVIQDVTERKALEAQLRHSQMMQAVGTLAGGVAHDFNNYLTVVAGHAELLADSLSADHPLRESAEAILDACRRCASLTKQLLTLSRRRKAQPCALGLPGLIKGLEPMLRSLLGERFELRIDLDAGASQVYADPALIEQVVMNLVVNARDAMPRGGSITISVEDVLMDRRLADGAEHPVSGHYVKLSVRDEGIGMPENVRLRVFEPFFTTKGVGEGTGLGLSTVYGILVEAGGTVDVESLVGEGSTFHTYWPASGDGDVQEPMPPPQATLRGHGQRVLLVEDVEQVRELLRRQIEEAGYSIKTAADGVEALRLLERESVDVLVTDVVMPKMGGIELATRLRGSHPEVRCILMTGYSADVLDGGHETFETVMRKPFTPRDLVNAIGRLLGRDEPSS
jgi:two-component system cell cycle sensor histidine kinase/response regulator CckA